MELKIKYFGVLAEIAGCNEEKIRTEQLIISDIVDLIIKKHNYNFDGELFPPKTQCPNQFIKCPCLNYE